MVLLHPISSAVPYCCLVNLIDVISTVAVGSCEVLCYVVLNVFGYIRIVWTL
jgi:hypothetical protein